MHLTFVIRGSGFRLELFTDSPDIDAKARFYLALFLSVKDKRKKIIVEWVKTRFSGKYSWGVSINGR
jgi:hypothetical protein